MKLLLMADDNTTVLGHVDNVERFGEIGLEESRPGSFRMTHAFTMAVAIMLYQAPEVPIRVREPEPTPNVVDFHAKRFLRRV